MTRDPRDEAAREVERTYGELITACWPLFRNSDCAAARLSILYELYPEFTTRKFSVAPEFFGPLKEDVPLVTDRKDPAFAQTAWTVREGLKRFRTALDQQVKAELATEQELTRMEPSQAPAGAAKTPSAPSPVKGQASLTDDDQGQLLSLDLQITEARKDYLRARDHLQLLVRQLNGGEGTVDALYTTANEFGADAAMNRLRAEPGAFGFSSALNNANQEHLQTVLQALAYADTDLDHAIGARENILCHYDPSRQRSYNFDGREFVLDPNSNRMKFDGEDVWHDLKVSIVEPLDVPSLERVRALQQEVDSQPQPERRRERKL